MNKRDAKLIARTITNEQIQEMIDTAKKNITDWTVASVCNKLMSKGVAWNILVNVFDVDKPNHHLLHKMNLIREFGEYLPDELKPNPKPKKPFIKPIHQDPIFKPKKV